MAVLVFLALLTTATFAAPALACGTGGASTFCADGWIAAPLGPRDRAAGPPSEEGAGWSDGSDPVSPDDIWVEGAVPVEAEGTDTGAGAAADEGL